MRKLIERYRRRPDFQEENCTPVQLSDGQSWYLQRPWLEVIPHFVSGEAVDCVRMPSLGDLDPLLLSIADEADPIKQSLLVLTLGAMLLQRSYDVSDQEMSRLFILRPGDPDSDRMLCEIIAVATGNASQTIGWEAISDPKVRGGGSDPS